MHLKRLLQIRANRGSRIVSLGLALMFGASLTIPPVRAEVSPPDASGSQPAPPSYPDEDHVCNGCHLSTLRYLSQYLSQFPAEHGEPLLVNMLNADGTRGMHTLALISWRGHAWCRDEYFGVFALGCAYEGGPNLDRLTAKAESSYQRHVRNLIRKEGTPQRPVPPEELTQRERFREVTLATQIIPYPSTIYWLRSGRGEFPVAFFRPSGRQIAVYDPLSGTSLAECSIRDDAKVVSLVAGRLGYRPEVRRELAIQDEALLADAGASK